MRPRWSTYLFLAFSAVLLMACRAAKYVDDGSYLLTKNEVYFVNIENGTLDTSSKHEFLSGSEMEEFVRPVPNRKFRLWVYNRIDTAKHSKQVSKKKLKFAKKNEKRDAKMDRINKKRIRKARAKGKDFYKPKKIEHKETKLGWRDYVRTNWGEAPVILDTFRISKSSKQLEIYLRKRGFRYGSVRDTIIYKDKKKKAKTEFYVAPKEPYFIQAITFDSIYRNRQFMSLYDRMGRNEGHVMQIGDLLDEDKMDEERDRFAQFCRDNAYYGFNKKYINYEVDTLFGEGQAVVKFIIKQRRIPKPGDSTKTAILPFRTYKVKDVTFRLHNPDTASFGKNWDDYVKRCKARGLEPWDGKQFALLDTIRLYRKGTFAYNYSPFVKPDLLDDQNFLEITGPRKEKDSVKYYKEYYEERTYRTMNGLGVFETINTRVIIDPENPLADSILVFYDLTPAKKQSFLIEPRTTNTNGVLGLSGGFTYTNKNCFRGAQRLETSLIGGMEAQPDIINDGSADDGNVRFSDIVNTFEIGPTLSLRFPKLVPLSKKLQDKLSKRLYPSTIYKSSVNIQSRREFLRIKGNFTYEWNFKEGKTREWRVSLIDLNFIDLDPKGNFQETLDSINDPFLINAYSDHFTSSFAVNWHYNNLNSNRRMRRQSKNIHDLDVKLMESGAIMYATQIGFKNQVNGQRTIFGVPFTTFLKFDINYIINQYINEGTNLAFRFFVGAGRPWCNSPSLPYEYSFFAGGSNDNRAFSAKTMAPGNTEKYYDLNLPLTQIGDMKLAASAEYRFKMFGFFEGAIFADAGNIWLLKTKSAEKGPADFQWNNFINGVALGSGLGLRADLDFLVFRLDFGWPIHNPYLIKGERWIFQPLDDYYNTLEFDLGVDPKEIKNPHGVNVSFGIGYPF